MKNNIPIARIISLQEAARISASMKRTGKTLVVVNGSFDVLHSGHIALLRKARSFGDALLVLLNSDTSVRRYKGLHRPIVPEEERTRMLAGISGVDYIALFDDINPKKAFEKIRPQVYCNGSDWGKSSVERAVIEKYGGVVKLVPLVKGYSTSRLLKAVVAAERTPSTRAVFLDRDGTINDNKSGFVHTKEAFTLLPGVLSALKALSKTDFKLIIVTNQSGIARGHYTRKQVERLHSWLISSLRKHGVRIDAVYICPHHPDDTCDCRKPGVALFEQAARKFGLSLAKSWMIGDSDSDVVAGREANTKTVKLGKRMDRSLKLEPDHYAKDLKEAVAFILAKDRQ